MFVYYDVPFYAYQDKIVSFAVVAYICLFANSALHRTAVPAAIAALGVTVLGLSAVNASEALGVVLEVARLSPKGCRRGLSIGLYFVLLVALCAADRRVSRSDE